MDERPRHRRARLWAWVYAVLFRPEDCPDAGTGEGREESADGAGSRDRSDRP
jgi:hypothetical protein